MPLTFLSNSKWPKSYGFEIYGSGPTYVVAVEENSTAQKAGLLPGDQILELDGQDVTVMSAAAVKTLAQKSQTQPPSLEVVSRVTNVKLEPTPGYGYGFSVLHQQPIVISSIEYGGPAYKSGVRVGDIILEVNGRHLEKSKSVGSMLSKSAGKLSMTIIPVSHVGDLVHVDKGLSRLPNSDLRVQRAKDLYDKLWQVLEDDYERKIAVVAILKQYAEDRDIHVLCASLKAILTTMEHRNLLHFIRLLVTPHQRPVFDELLKSSSTNSSPMHSNMSAEDSSQAAHVVGNKMVIQVFREGGSFGFVIKGCNPAYIESVDPGGPADKAGLMAGDFLIKLNGLDVRRCDHDLLVKLLQDSGSTPALQILRCHSGQEPVLSPALSLNSLSSSSSESSHESDLLLSFEEQILNRDGKTFSQNAEYLLTPREWYHLKKAVLTYKQNRDIVMLYDSLEPILDTPSKCILWKFILLSLQPQHYDYILHRVGLPQHLLTELLEQDQTRNTNINSISSIYRGNNIIPQERPVHVSPQHSFHHHIHFLLTSTERLQFKAALTSYQENHDLHHLMEVMKLILDTPSKSILWRYVLLRLTPAHQGIVRQTFDIPDSQSRVEAKKKRNGKRDTVSISSSDESSVDDCEMKMDLARSNVQRSGKVMVIEDSSLLKELLATGQTIEKMKKSNQERNDGYEESEDDADDQNPLQTKHFVTIIPVGSSGLDINHQPLPSKSVDLFELSSFHNFAFEAREINNTVRMSHQAGSDDNLTSSESEEEITFTEKVFDLLKDKSLLALKEVEVDMAYEVSNVHNSPSHQPVAAPKAKGLAASRNIPPPPPPPPPPPLLGSDGNVEVTHASGSQMNIKRINWEKLDNEHLENTIWEQLSDRELLEMIHLLELETQFSTKPSKTINQDKKKEICIMNSKKAYNISILFGHLKMSVSEIKQAIFLMDEEILTPELLRQLITYAPSAQEMTQYDAYTGEKELLSKPDRFAYEMSKLYGYKQRLEALLFKANFKEKMEEMRKNFYSIKKASHELQHSKTLARILELILAMGNYLNKGNTRVGEAAGFKISFLKQLDVTKTADSKSTFLHVLAETVYKKFPQLLALGDELENVAEAAKVSNVSLNQEIQELRKGLQEISSTLEKIGSQRCLAPTEDNFQNVMGHFIAQASDDIQSLFRLQTSAMEEFSSMVTFFGEDPHQVTTSEIFEIFYDFIKKFEKAHRHNMMYKHR